ncbi:MAG: hypothetical protein ACXVQR_03430, partial [Solirubrobacteraceae bacterium]
RSERHGREPFFVEGRDLPPMPDALEAVLAGARHHPRPLVLIDTYERMAALDGYLRRGLLLRDAAERAFGETENEKLFHRMLVRGYIEPAPSHEQAALDLALGRAAYFRRLRAAAERVAEFLAARA